MEDLKFTTAEGYMEDQKQEEVKRYLSEGVAKIVFTKKDGTSREMIATLCTDRIPSDMMPKSEERKAYSSDVQRVFDVEAKGWRSFRWDSVIEYGRHYVD